MLRNFIIFSHWVNPRCWDWLGSPFTFYSFKVGPLLLTNVFSSCSHVSHLQTQCLDSLWHRKLMSSHEEIQICFVKSLQSVPSAQIKARPLTSNLCSCADLSGLQHRGQWRQHGLYEGQLSQGFPPFAGKNTMGGRQLHTCWSINVTRRIKESIVCCL